MRSNRMDTARSSSLRTGEPAPIPEPAWTGSSRTSGVLRTSMRSCQRSGGPHKLILYAFDLLHLERALLMRPEQFLQLRATFQRWPDFHPVISTDPEECGLAQVQMLHCAAGKREGRAARLLAAARERGSPRRSPRHSANAAVPIPSLRTFASGPQPQPHSLDGSRRGRKNGRSGEI
jgi:hypothetical protein